MIERRPPAPYAQSTAAEPHQMSALQPPYFTMQRVLAALDAERVEHQAPRYRDIERDRDQSAAHQCALLGGKHEPVRHHRVEQRLDAETVARQKQISGLGVVDRESPHAV